VDEPLVCFECGALLAYLRHVWTAVNELKKQGVSAEEAATRADLSRHQERFPNPAVPLIGVQRIYALIDALRDSSALVARQRSTHESRSSTGKRPVTIRGIIRLPGLVILAADEQPVGRLGVLLHAHAALRVHEVEARISGAWVCMRCRRAGAQRHWSSLSPCGGVKSIAPIAIKLQAMQALRSNVDADARCVDSEGMLLLTCGMFVPHPWQTARAVCATSVRAKLGCVRRVSCSVGEAQSKRFQGTAVVLRTRQRIALL